jgi:hypothetical protein
MATPVVESIAVTDDQFTTTHAINLPGSLASGDLILIAFACDNNNTAAAITADAGYNFLFETGTDGESGQFALLWREATGSEGATMTINTSGTERSAAHAWRITGAEDPDTQPPEYVRETTHDDTNDPDPPNLTPTGGSKDYLWIAISLAEDSNQTLNSYPSGYTGNQTYTRNDALSTNAGSVASAEQALTAASENPGIFDFGTAPGMVTGVTVAIHPSSGALGARVTKMIGVALFGKQVGKGISGAASPTPAFQKRAGKRVEATAIPTPLIKRQMSKTLAAVMTGTATLAATLVFLISLVATVTGVAVILKRVGINMPATTTLTPAIQRQVGKTLRVTAVAIGAFQLRVGKILRATQIGVADLVASAGKTVLMEATMIGVAKIQRQMSKTLAATMTAVMTVRKAVALTLRATATLIGTIGVTGPGADVEDERKIWYKGLFSGLGKMRK